MGQERLGMKKLKEVLRLHFECNLSNRVIARALKISATTIGYYVKAAYAAGIAWSEVASFNDSAIQEKLLPHCPQLKPKGKSTAIDFANIHQELKNKGLTRELLHEEYRRTCPEGQGISYSGVRPQSW